MEYWGLHNKPKAAVHPELLPTRPFEEEVNNKLNEHAVVTDNRQPLTS
jgi:hypothetical protein